MRIVWRLLMAVVACSLVGRAVLAGSDGVAVSVADGFVAPAGEWVMLTVEVPNYAQGANIEVSLQDVRGGPVIVRSVPAALTGKGGGGKLWVPLPLIGESELAEGLWPVEVVVRRDGKEVEKSRVNVALGMGTGSMSGSGTFRVAVPQGSESRAETEGVAWSAISPLPVALVSVPEDEILSGPGLLFASCDVVMLPRNFWPRMSPEQMGVLLNAGVRLVAMGDRPPGTVSGLVWDRIEGASVSASMPAGAGRGEAAANDGVGAWISAASSVRRTWVIEPGLARVDNLRRGVQPNGTVRAAVILLGPAAIVMVLLARAMFVRRWIILGVIIVAMMGLTAGMIAYLRMVGPMDEHVARWHMTAAPKKSPGGVVTLDEAFTSLSPLFADEKWTSGQIGSILLPVAASTHEYWALHDLRLVLDTAADSAATRLHIDIPARGRVTYVMRSLKADGLMPSYPRTPQERTAFVEQTNLDLKQGWWLKAGYMYADGGKTGAADGMLLTQWIQAEAPESVRDSIRAWQEMRFDAQRVYFFKQAGGELVIVDFGAAD